MAPYFSVILRTRDGVHIDAAHTPYRSALHAGEPPVASLRHTGVVSHGAPAGRERVGGEQPRLGIVLAHGFTGSWREQTTRRITHALSAFGGVLSFDFRGHGRSAGESTVGDSEVFDVEAAVRHVRGLDYDRVAVVGFSMGAATAVRHAALHGGVDAVVAVSGPSRWYYRGTRSMRRVHWAIEQPLGRAVARLVKGTRVRSASWDPVPAAPHEVAGLIAPTPLLVVHGDADAFFPVEHAYQLYGAAREPKELWIEQGYGHAESAATPALINKIGRWIHHRIP
ncbi:alpha/beta hydrolase [Rhizohabitans arisaemae]|uniref:alpha/beta hydrolase n=1 Tax=Rhizohabitans arisaemae TaxID=2720610 RepID=UPI0024B08C3C|nr:alpha/beta fold hydrolase [Rhizohabitans arisaemae]